MNAKLRFIWGFVPVIIALVTGHWISRSNWVETLPEGELLSIRDRLMAEKYSRPRKESAPVNIVVIHFSSDAKANPDAPFDVGKVIGIYETYGVSAHYLIDRAGIVYRLVKDERQAFHAGKGKLPWLPSSQDSLNLNSIGIELLAIGSRKDMAGLLSPEQFDHIATKHPDYLGFTERQYQSLNLLLKALLKRFPEIKWDRRHIVGHSDYAPGRKTDPGELFDWTKLGLPRAVGATNSPPISIPP